MRAFLIAAGIAVASIAVSYAQIGGGNGIYNRFGSSGGGGGGACNAGALDLSQSTGCNVQFYIHGVFP